MLQLNENPPIAFSASSGRCCLDEGDWSRPWLAAYCKPRQEKALAWDLRRRESSYFLPMVLRETSSGGRRRRNLYPLFPSYIFIPSGDAERLVALKTDRIVRLIDVNEAQQPRLRSELTALEAALHHCPDSLELYPRLALGARVLVKAGPLKGVEGNILQFGSKRKLWLGVTALGVGATVEIHPDLVEPL
jgi:transcription antitermination factor NusG